MTENTLSLDLPMTDEQIEARKVETAAALVNTIKNAVNGVGKYAAYVEAHGVTRETVKDHALTLATLAYPNEKPVQKKDGKRTKFGNAVQAAGNGLRSALASDEADDEAATPDYLALAVQAAKTAHDKGAVSIDAVLDAIRTSLVTGETPDAE